MPVTQITFIGHTRERIIESIRALRELPVTRIILAVGKPDTSGERKARRVAREIADELKTIFDVEIVEIDKKNIMNAVLELVEVAERERENGNEVVFNVSGSLRTFAIAAYIAASITNSRVFSSIPKYGENDEEEGIEEIVELPILPVSFPGKEQMEILKAIGDGVSSLDELVIKLNPEIDRGSREFQSERSRLSHHLSKLERAGFVKREKHGRNVKIMLTELGKAITAALN
ncbi:DUF6293 family protein [Geoglobus acetivorans]|uniref:DUF6293 family protein n=1 Tax=Geoglobus acetivorans TaxID=565033 RepID=A0ABZ3H320_GEOAI|nr:transcriptional regulator [Geoglobus acetivorans]